jgi:signal transduction histidine kinase
VNSVTRRPLRLLHLEDNDLDHQLVMAQFQRAGWTYSVHRVDSSAGFQEALESPWDAILSDYNLPGYNGLQALNHVRRLGIDVPFLLISGEIGEDMAVQAMRNGASDYLLKNNLARLVPALEHALEASEGRRARVASETALARSREQLSALAQHLQTSVEMERAAIAREIHDDVGGSLTALKFDLAWIDRRSDDPDLRVRVRHALETVTHAIEASQRIMHNLRPAILEQGLVAALQWMTSRFERRTGIVTQFRTSHEVIQLPAGVPLVAYRVAQEALTNVSKHAGATKCRVDLTQASGVLSLEISDNGRGLNQGDLEKSRSFGIRGLRERADTVGGWVELSSGTPGTTLILSIPLPRRTAAPIREPEAHLEADPHDPSGWGAL